MEAAITLEYGDEKIAEAVAAAVSPDNFKTPAGLLVKTGRSGKRVLSEVKFDGKMATFIATIDDLLFSVCTAEKTLHVMKRE